MFKAFLSDRFSDSWRLLSETTQFLSRTPAFLQYEDQLRSWRQELQSAGKNSETARQIRSEITELRKTLRLQGYDLSLAGQQLVVDKFRNDSALGEGFKRLVIFFCDDEAFYLSGDDNHITLSDMLESRMNALPKRLQIHSKHYIWYKRQGNVLTLSGSDTETKEDFQRLKAMADANSLVILSRLKALR